MGAVHSRTRLSRNRHGMISEICRMGILFLGPLTPTNFHFVQTLNLFFLGKGAPYPRQIYVACRSRPQLSKKRALCFGPLPVFEIWTIQFSGKNSHFSAPVGVAIELSGPFCAHVWVVPRRQGTPGSGAKFGGQAPRTEISEFAARRVSPVLWPTFPLAFYAPPWVLPRRQGTPGSGAKFGGQAPRTKISEFSARRVFCVLWPTFFPAFCQCWRRLTRC